MAGNQTIFQEAIRKAHNFAWDKKWPQAIAEYQRALREFDNDALVWLSLGAALLELKRAAEAKDAYRRASELLPNDIGVHQKLAQLYQQLGDVENALQTYLIVATAHMKSGELSKAVESWRAILKLNPSHLESHRQLAELLERLNRHTEAAQANFVAAQLLAERNRASEALERARKALALDPRRRDARSLIERLQLSAPTSALGLPSQPMAPVSVAESPVQQMVQQALAQLAESVFERAPATQDASQHVESSALITQAIDLQARGKSDGAIQYYQRALAAGASQPEIHFNLGLLCQAAGRFDEAIHELSQTAQLPQFAAVSQMALSQCYQAQGRSDKAVEHLLEPVKMVELQNLEHAQREGVRQLYQELAESYAADGNRDSALALLNALSELMSVKGWEDRIRALRRRLNAAAGTAKPLNVTDLLLLANPERVLDSLSASQDYLRRQKLTAAVEECYHAIAMAPSYLPLHWRLAEIFLSQGRVEDAIDKYTMMAAVQTLRGQTWQVMDTYRQILKISPEDVSTRARLIVLLLRRGVVEEAIEQFILLGSAYYRVAQLEQALNAYQEALRLIPRTREDRWSVTILHQLGEIYMQRLAWTEATEVYQRIRELSPADDKASLRLIDLYSKQGRDEETLRELDYLIAQYEQTGERANLLNAVAELAAVRTKSLPLKSRLADLLLQTGQSEQAVAELDSLGEMQLTAGQTYEAMQTIERIVALHPANVESYRELLAQLREGL